MCPHSEKPCIRRHDCERCKVPEAYGFFLRWEKGKAIWEQRFIREADRAAIIAYHQGIIAREQKSIERIKEIPGV